MAPTPSSQPLAACSAALSAAHARLLEALRQDADHFGSLGEFLWWAGIVDSLLKSGGGGYVRTRDHECPLILGLRHARNLVAHGQNPTDVSKGPGITLPATLPWFLGPARWRPLHEMSPLKEAARKAEAAYTDHLAEQALVSTTADAMAFLNGAVTRLV